MLRIGDSNYYPPNNGMIPEPAVPIMVQENGHLNQQYGAWNHVQYYQVPQVNYVPVVYPNPIQYPMYYQMPVYGVAEEIPIASNLNPETPEWRCHEEELVSDLNPESPEWQVEDGEEYAQFISDLNPETPEWRVEDSEEYAQFISDLDPESPEWEVDEFDEDEELEELAFMHATPEWGSRLHEAVHTREEPNENMQLSETRRNWSTPNTLFNHQYRSANLINHSNVATNAIDDTTEDVAEDLNESFSSCYSDQSKTSQSLSETSMCSPPGSPCSANRAATRRRRKPRSSRVLESRQIKIVVPEPAPVIVKKKMAPLERFRNLKMTEEELSLILSKYIVCKTQRASLGYPIESEYDKSSAIIFAVDFNTFRKNCEAKPMNYYASEASWMPEDDSGQGSGSSSPRSPDSESEEDRSKVVVERKCSRCSRGFMLTGKGEYLTGERCRYHYGRLLRSGSSEDNHFVPVFKWSCCDGAPKGLGCTRAPLHVWSGTTAGFNGPISGYMHTRPRTAWRQCKEVIALDCEMVYTASGLQLAQLEIVGLDGLSIYSTYIKPDEPIIDYNTRFSGITEEKMRGATKSLAEVQTDLLEIMDADTILIGHGLENDLRALRILHGSLVDTAVCFPHERGLPYRQSLKALALQFLDISIQNVNHCPLEDARVSMDLMLWRLHRDYFANSLSQ